MPTADSYERIAAAKATAAQKAAAAKPTLNFSAWDSASPAAQAKYTPVVPKPAPPAPKPTLNFSAWDSASAAAQEKYTPVLPGVQPAPSGGGDSSSGGSGNTGGGSGNSGGGSSSGSSTPAVKPATPDIITINQETLPAELMTSLIFEDIGGHELLSISRHDLISGSNMDYQSIKNLNDIYINHNSLNIIPMPDSSSNYIKDFPIVWEDHIIETFLSLDSSHITLNTTDKELQLLVSNMKSGEQIEVQVLSSVSGYNYTTF